MKSRKDFNYDKTYLEILNDKLAEIGGRIYTYRSCYINNINDYIDVIYKDLSGIDGLKIDYLSDLENKEIYKQKLRDSINGDLKYKYTQLGIHHDNYVFKLHNHNLADYGSQGQMRLGVLSLKLAELEVMINILKIKPILLLDDIFSELDIRNKNNVIKYLNDDVQVIATTTDVNLISDEILKKSNIINLELIKERMNNNEY